jgi:hypothetical protein
LLVERSIRIGRSNRTPKSTPTKAMDAPNSVSIGERAGSETRTINAKKRPQTIAAMGPELTSQMHLCRKRPNPIGAKAVLPISIAGCRSFQTGRKPSRVLLIANGPAENVNNRIPTIFPTMILQR